jgi:N-sulfoglucosamine sulfohydrolase
MKRYFIILAILAMILSAVFLWGLNIRPKIADNLGKPDKRPNILFIVSEDNGMELGCYGTPIKTPNLDELARQGVLFTNSYVTQAGCSPSRASFLTGLYPHQHGQIGLATWDYSMYQDITPNLVSDLKNSGYRTGIIGKVHVNPEDAFDFEWHEIKGGNFARNNLDRYASAAYEFIQSSDIPFFLQVNYPDAHVPFITQIEGRPSSFLTANDVEAIPFFGVTSQQIRQQTADYYNCIMRLDEMIGELLVKLRESGKYDNTLIVYIGDHGVDMLRGKRTCYEGGVRIPLIISWPNGAGKNIVYSELVSTIDLYPTFMEVSGNPIPSHLPGKSLLPVLKGQKEPLRKYLFTEYHVHSNHNPFPQRTIRDERYKLIHNLVAGHENPGYHFTIGKKIDPTDFNNAVAAAPKNVADAYERMRKPPEYELYDLKKDPFEWDNLADNSNFGEIFTRLKKNLYEWQIRTNDPLVDKKIAEKLFLEVVNANEKRIEIKYHDYMDPQIFQ